MGKKRMVTIFAKITEIETPITFFRCRFRGKLIFYTVNSYHSVLAYTSNPIDS